MTWKVILEEKTAQNSLRVELIVAKKEAQHSQAQLEALKKLF
jgi:hypothetical protein